MALCNSHGAGSSRHQRASDPRCAPCFVLTRSVVRARTNRSWRPWPECHGIVIVRWSCMLLSMPGGVGCSGLWPRIKAPGPMVPSVEEGAVCTASEADQWQAASGAWPRRNCLAGTLPHRIRGAARYHELWLGGGARAPLDACTVWAVGLSIGAHTVSPGSGAQYGNSHCESRQWSSVWEPHTGLIVQPYTYCEKWT